MAFICQCFTQFCSQHPASAESRIANNANIHGAKIAEIPEGLSMMELPVLIVELYVF
jgi:hypothetical protein